MTQQHQLIPMATGEYLKSLRLGRKLSLADAAKAVILDERLLQAIEEDNADHMALLYRNGYIRTYARFLKVPEDEISALLVSGDTREPALHHVFTEPPKRSSTEKWLRASSYVLASLLVGTLAWQFTHEAVRLSQNGSRLQEGEGVAAESSAAISPTRQQSVSGPVNASIAPLGALHGKGANGLDSAEEAWAALSRPAITDGESRLKVIVSADSWVEITDANGQQLEMDLLRGGSDRSYHGQPPFKFLFGRASAVRLSLDGEAVDLTEFTRDDVAQLTWPQQLRAENGEPDIN
jgi:cytoskeleton protein RodZ